MSSSGVTAYEHMIENQEEEISNEIIKLLKSKTFRTNLYVDNSVPLSVSTAINILEFTLNKIQFTANSQRLNDLLL